MKSEELLKEWLGKRVHHADFGDGTVIGIRGGFGNLILVEFDKEIISGHAGVTYAGLSYGKYGKDGHCWYFYPGDIVTMLKEDKKMENTGKPKTSGDLIDFISFLRNDYKTSKKERKIIADFLNLLEEGYVKIECIPKKDEDGLQEVATTSRCYPYLDGEIYQKDGGETTFSLPREEYKSILRKLTNQKEVPEPTKEELRATVKLYYKDKWDEETGRNEAVKKMESKIKSHARIILFGYYCEVDKKIENYTMGEKK